MKRKMRGRGQFAVIREQLKADPIDEEKMLRNLKWKEAEEALRHQKQERGCNNIAGNLARMGRDISTYTVAERFRDIGENLCILRKTTKDISKEHEG